MSAHCTSTPISWLRLERYKSGECDAADRAAIETHLATCAACAECFAGLEREDAVPLPPLVIAPSSNVTRIETRGRRVAMIAGALALAAAAIVGIGQPWRHGGPDVSDAGNGGSRVKGEGVSFSLVGDDGEWIVEAGGAFRDGARFKAVVTCPPSLDATFDVVVLDASGASYPLSPVHLVCGNEVPIPGAFRLSGSAQETVCVVWSEAPIAPEREGASFDPNRIGDHALCKTLAVATPR